jgi:predicted nucleic acid-binding protein
MIHLDTGFLIRALVADSLESGALGRWLAAGETLGVSAVVWAEFLCGPVGGGPVELAEQMFGPPVALAGPEAAHAARLFVLGDRRRGWLADCMIAATAIRAEAALATTNPKDFQRFAGQGLRLV